METDVPFGSKYYWITFGILFFARGMDFLSTWIATPNLRLEGNPIAKFLGWKWGSMVNLAVCAVAAHWPIPAMMIVTTSFLVAARNFSSAWIAQGLGEDRFRVYLTEAAIRVNLRIYVICVLGEGLLTAAIAAALIYFSGQNDLVLSMGYGVLGYAIVVIFFPLLALWRLKRGGGAPPPRAE